MTTQELEQLIEGQTETQNLEFKSDSPWDVNKLAKDILAISNVRDGGQIIIGVRENDNLFISEGVSESNLSTYSIDIMKDQLYRFADPPVLFKVSFPKDRAGKKFVVITVFPFIEVPVISKINISGVIAANTIYYRNTNKRIESAPVSNSKDLRDIIEWAAIKLMQKRKEFGYEIPTDNLFGLDREIEHISEHEILTKIKSKGYWELKYQPLNKEDVSFFDDWKAAIDIAQVKKYWYFPFISTRIDKTQGFSQTASYYESWSKYGSKIELWRAYKSGQFILYEALSEDWYAEDEYLVDLAQKITPGKYVSMVRSVIHFITQAIEFAARLGTEGFFKSGIKITLTLNKVENRILYTDSDDRMPLLHPRKTAAIQLPVEGKFQIEDLVENSLNISNKFIRQIFDAFGYNPLEKAVLADQQKFLSGN